MKITKTYLKEIIKEELTNIHTKLDELGGDDTSSVTVEEVNLEEGEDDLEEGKYRWSYVGEPTTKKYVDSYLRDIGTLGASVTDKLSEKIIDEIINILKEGL